MTTKHLLEVILIIMIIIIVFFIVVKMLRKPLKVRRASRKTNNLLKTCWRRKIKENTRLTWERWWWWCWLSWSWWKLQSKWTTLDDITTLASKKVKILSYSEKKRFFDWRRTNWSWKHEVFKGQGAKIAFSHKNNCSRWENEGWINEEHQIKMRWNK